MCSFCGSAWLLVGEQRVAKFHERHARNTIAVYMALFRLPQYASDIVVTFNDPLHIHPESSSSQRAAGGAMADGDAGPPAMTPQQFRACAVTLTLHDTGLFG